MGNFAGSGKRGEPQGHCGAGSSPISHPIISPLWRNATLIFGEESGKKQGLTLCACAAK